MKLTKRQLTALIESIILDEEEDIEAEDVEAETDAPASKETEVDGADKKEEVDEAGKEPDFFEFTLSVLGEKIDMSFEKNNNQYEVSTLESSNAKIQALLNKASPRMILAICYEKMKDLTGLDDGDSKRKFSNITKFVRNYDLSTKDIEDDEGVFKKIQSYLIRYFRPEIKKITDVVEKTQKNKM